MSFIQLAQERYSVRKFAGIPVEQEKLELILKAGQHAPTACNIQPQRILVLNSGEALEKLKKCTPCHFNAPLTLLVCCDTSESWKRGQDGKDHGEMDAAIVATHMILEAKELGIGCTWVCFFDPAAIREAFSLPDHIVPVCLLPMGYPAVDSSPNPQHSTRKPLKETVCYNEFGK